MSCTSLPPKATLFPCTISQFMNLPATCHPKQRVGVSLESSLTLPSLLSPRSITISLLQCLLHPLPRLDSPCCYHHSRLNYSVDSALVSWLPGPPHTIQLLSCTGMGGSQSGEARAAAVPQLEMRRHQPGLSNLNVHHNCLKSSFRGKLLGLTRVPDSVGVDGAPELGFWASPG